ncbi:hypothetical protein SEA_SAPO_37 [Gordonia phage Sapo]|nr:hypothetical protein SEA_SAPO_37 [Gordonia phage Sapo]
MKKEYRTAGPTSPGAYPVVDVLFEQGTGGNLHQQLNQLYLRQEGKLLYFCPTDPDRAPTEWALNVDRLVSFEYRWTAVLEEQDFERG